MKPSKKKSWKVPKKKSAEAGPNDDDSKDGAREEKVAAEYELTDVDKLFLASVETGLQDSGFNALYYFLNITSIKALKEYNPTGNDNYAKFLQPNNINTMKHKICDKDFDFQKLALKFKHSNVTETCSKKGIRIIKREDLKEVKPITIGVQYYDVVCQAQWTRPDGIKEKVCLRYEYDFIGNFLLEAEMSTLLHHPNILPLHGVIISSSFSPSVALVVEFAEYGNLHESSVHRSVERLCRFTIQTASALEHLEKKNVVHTSVDSFTCLVVSKDQVKLSGLGVCRFKSELDGKLSQSYALKNVVYQFAKLFSTYFGRYEELTPDTIIAKNINKLKFHGSYGPLCPPHFCEVFDRCLSKNPDARPSFKDIRQSLVASNYALKVKVINSFSAESAEFLSCRDGELITLIAKDCHRKDKTAWLGETEDRIIGFFKSENVQEQFNYDSLDGSFVPAEIRGRGPRAERAFQKAMRSGKVKVYRGRIMLLGQDRAGKTSLKKSLLGLPFDPNQESTIGVEVDPSKCDVEVDRVKNWMPNERKKREVSEFEEELARFIARDLSETKADHDDSTATNLDVEEVKTTDLQEEKKDQDEPELLSHVDKPATDTQEKSDNLEDGAKAIYEEKPVDNDQVNNELQLNINSTTLPNDVTDLVVRYLQSLRLEDDIKAKEIIFTLWDFAGQHLYYASHSVFLSGRAVYVLVYNLNKNLLATAEPCVRQGIHDIVLDNPNNETNLDNLLSWLVSVHNIRSDANESHEDDETKQFYLRPPVIIVGTHSDQPFEDVETAERHIKKGISKKAYVKHIMKPFFAVDNRTENEGVQKLRHRIMEVLKGEPYMGEELPLRWFNFEKAVDALVEKQTYFMDLDRLISIIRQVCHIDDEEEMTAMLNFYHDLGVIVKHGGTVVLQARWLIDLFKQLITVRPFDEADLLYLDCWEELEENGILRIALVDHVFSEFMQKGLNKQDILDMMELYGLIAKFSIATGENGAEQKYFVPTQLRSSPSGLYEIKPSECDPCPLILHFRDGFVPHGLFPQLLSKFIHWCSENGLKETPQLFNNGARLFIGKQIAFDLILICGKRLIKVILKRRNLTSSKSSLKIATNIMAVEVRNFIEETLVDFSRKLCWLSNLRYELSVVCTHCLRSKGSLDSSMSCYQDDFLHLLRVSPGKELICRNNFSDKMVKVPGWEMWFEVLPSQTEEPEMDNSEPVGVDESFSFKTGIPSRDDILLIAHELGSSWKVVGRLLNASDAVIDQIEADESKIFDRCYSVLTRWKEMCGSDATYQQLARALQDPLVEKSHLADKFCGLQFCKDKAVTKDC
ncbi:PREDICTED: uncharacterized protein LOC107327650 isoform X2 [Acropora digitifera]|uniref:uncharacterized protein LOC107327650 isoform X2 n=1 Tax=Acropora digitifera TaxID=70779 RepID=UPI00077A58DB|nr:PREDICTED: uncharacterized protein LOC107327650 isoform X2 [Acropora digitifera]